MLGGRDGSSILKTNELLKFPGQYNALNMKHWSWTHKVGGCGLRSLLELNAVSRTC